MRLKQIASDLIAATAAVARKAPLSRQRDAGNLRLDPMCSDMGYKIKLAINQNLYKKISCHLLNFILSPLHMSCQ